MAISEEITESESDDTQSVDFNLNTLVNRFINPIEAKRSFVTINPITRPQSRREEEAVSRDLDVAQPNREAQESRAHTFYRMISLPVMDANGNFYNPGFNPILTSEQRRNNAAISNNPSTIVDQTHAAREQAVRNNSAIFQSSPQNSSILSLAMKKVKKFQVLNDQENFDFLNQRDQQQFTVRERRQFLNNFYELPNGDPLPRFFEQGTHILRPFLVSPIIERTVQSKNRAVCAPFLPSIDDTRLEGDRLLDRPGIEFILRLRLRQETSTDAVDETIFILDPDIATADDLSTSDLRRIALAIFDQENVSAEDLVELETAIFSNLELITINKLIKLIKASVEELDKAIETIDNVSKLINWTPLPGRNGPRDANNIRVSGFVSTKRAGSELERRIKLLEVKAANARRRGVISDDEEIANANFALSYFENTEKLFSQELEDAKEEKIETIRQGANALATIEIITGEVSGFGLVDILSVYTALWAIDLDVLLSLLDGPSFQRLVDNNPDLINSNVQARRDNGNRPIFDGKTAMQKLEAQIISILAWADKLFQQKQATPDTAEGGALPQGE